MPGGAREGSQAGRMRGNFLGEKAQKCRTRCVWEAELLGHA